MEKFHFLDIIETSQEFESLCESHVSSTSSFKGEKFRSLSLSDEDSEDLPVIVALGRKNKLQPVMEETGREGGHKSSDCNDEYDHEGFRPNSNAETRHESFFGQESESSNQEWPDTFSSDGSSYHPESQNENSTNKSSEQVEENVFGNNDSSSSEEDTVIDTETVCRLFRKRLKRYNISQRMAAREILKCFQSNLSELYSKAKRIKSSKNLTQRVYKKTSYASKSQGKKSVKFTSVQKTVSVKLYRKDSRPSVKKIELSAEAINLEISQVRNWFNNQRARNFPAGNESSTQTIPEELDTFVNI